MWQKIKNFFDPRKDLFLRCLERLEEIAGEIAKEKKAPEPSITLLRHQLGSIDLSDVKEDEEMTEAERREYCAAIFAVFPRLEKDIKKFLYQQLMFSSNNATTWEQVIFGRGTFNGIDLLLDHWQKAQAEHIPAPKENFDVHSPIGEINER